MSIYTIILLSVFGFFISYKIYKNWRIEKESSPNLIYITLVFMIIYSLSLVFLNLTIKNLYQLATYDSFESKVISVSSYIDTDDDGRKYTMYTPTVELTINNPKETIIKELSISSGEKYEIGEIHKVVYNRENGILKSKEISSVFMLIGGLLFSLILFSFTIYGICFGLKIKMPFTILDLVAFIFAAIILPIGVVGLDIGLLYYVYERLVYGVKSDQPLFALIIAMFFAFTLTILIISFGYKLLNGLKFPKITFSSDKLKRL